VEPARIGIVAASDEQGGDDRDAEQARATVSRPPRLGYYDRP
jgi:hypothetical protein